jgi:hypothetical protein
MHSTSTKTAKTAAAAILIVFPKNDFVIDPLLFLLFGVTIICVNQISRESSSEIISDSLFQTAAFSSSLAPYQLSGFTYSSSGSRPQTFSLYDCQV